MQDRKLAILLYGFPPGVGATGTAALLNVPRSLERTLEALRQEGYDVGSVVGTPIDGEAIVAALQAQVRQRCMVVPFATCRSRSALSRNHVRVVTQAHSCYIFQHMQKLGSSVCRSSRGLCLRVQRASASLGRAMLQQQVLRVWVQRYLQGGSRRC